MYPRVEPVMNLNQTHKMQQEQIHSMKIVSTAVKENHTNTFLLLPLVSILNQKERFGKSKGVIGKFVIFLWLSIFSYSWLLITWTNKLSGTYILARLSTASNLKSLRKRFDVLIILTWWAERSLRRRPCWQKQGSRWVRGFVFNSWRLTDIWVYAEITSSFSLGVVPEQKSEVEETSVASEHRDSWLLSWWQRNASIA